MSTVATLATTAAGLRAEFDRAFALPPSPAATGVEDWLAIRVSGDPFVVRLGEIASVLAVKKITPIPSPAPELLGLAGIRGAIVPVFSLAALLETKPEVEAPRWLLTCGARDPVAFAIGAFEGHLRVASSAIAARSASDAARFSPELAATGLGVRPVIALSQLENEIRRRRNSPAREG